jgi:hypothetical protein
MSFVVTAPEIMTSAAADLASLGSMLSEARTAAAAPTTGVLAAAEDEVSAAIAAVFSAHGQGFQARGAQAAAFHDQFVKALSGAGFTYTAAEAANASLVSAPGLGPSSAAPAQPLHLPSLSSVINGFVNWLNQAVNSIHAFVNQAVNSISSFVNQAVNSIHAFVNQAVNSINSFVNQAVNSINSFVNQAVNSINSFVNQAVNAVNSVINSLLGLIRGIFPIL